MIPWDNLFSASDTVKIQVAQSLFALIGTIFTGILAYLMSRVHRQLHANAVAVGNIQDGVDEVHSLVNSNLQAQIKIAAVALRRIAEMTRHPDDELAATLAEKLYGDHVALQDAIAARLKGAPPSPG